MRTATGILLFAAVAAGCAPPEAAGAPRPLARVRHDRLPEHLPAAWAAQIDEAAAALPARALADPDAVARVRDCLLRVPWVDPVSIEVAPNLPDGIRASYRPRRPRLLLVRAGEPLGLLASDGVLLPPGFDTVPLEHFLTVPLEEGEPPAPGARCADPLVQEAVAAAVEALWVRDDLGVPITGIRRRPGVPRSVAGVPPELSFVCADGREIFWGWSAASTATVGPPEAVRVPLEVKGERMRRVVERWPGLEGLARVEVDRAILRVVDASGRVEEIP